MSQANFIRVVSSTTTGALGALPRSIVAVSRETISGFTPDKNSGLVSINAAQVAAFNAANPTKYGFLKFLQTAFAGNVQPSVVYLLSTGGVALTSTMLDTANYTPRSWSFLNVCSQTNGLDDESTFLADCLTAATWATEAKKKIFFFSFTAEPDINGDITLPAALLLGGSLTNKARTKAIITNAKDSPDEYTNVYHNPLLAALVFSLYGGSIARSIGSLSDAHDFPDVATDTYNATARAYIEAQSLAQYNGAKDQGGSLFVYDTFMNSTVNPPSTPQIETIIAEDYIDDYVTVFVRNTLQASGRTGVEASYEGLLEIYALTDTALQTMWQAGAILTNPQKAADYKLILKSLAQINALNPNWQTEGVIPLGAIVGSIAAFKALHYANIAFNYN